MVVTSTHWHALLFTVILNRQSNALLCTPTMWIVVPEIIHTSDSIGQINHI